MHMADRRTPFVNTSERDTLVAFLDYLRDAVLVKASGVDDDALRRALVPSGTSLLGLATMFVSRQAETAGEAAPQTFATFPADARLP